MRTKKEPTWTSLALAALIGRDDFMDYAMLRAATGATQNQLSAAMIHLRKRRAVDVVVNPDGHAWWFATPDTDDRTLIVELRTPEQRPRRRKSKVGRPS